MKKYKESMDNINVDENVRERILNAAYSNGKSTFARRISFRQKTRLVAAMLAGVMLASVLLVPMMFNVNDGTTDCPTPPPPSEWQLQFLQLDFEVYQSLRCDKCVDINYVTSNGVFRLDQNQKEAILPNVHNQFKAIFAIERSDASGDEWMTFIGMPVKNPNDNMLEIHTRNETCIQCIYSCLTTNDNVSGISTTKLNGVDIISFYMLNYWGELLFRVIFNMNNTTYAISVQRIENRTEAEIWVSRMTYNIIMSEVQADFSNIVVLEMIDIRIYDFTFEEALIDSQFGNFVLETLPYNIIFTWATRFKNNMAFTQSSQLLMFFDYIERDVESWGYTIDILLRGQFVLEFRPIGEQLTHNSDIADIYFANASEISLDLITQWHPGANAFLKIVLEFDEIKIGITVMGAHPEIVWELISNIRALQ